MTHSGPCGLHCIKVNHLGVEIEGQVILEDINLHIHCGKLNVIIGKNGAGKSTLVRAILNEIPHTGTIELKTHENGNLQKMKIGYVPQKVNIDRDTPMSVYDMIASYHSNFPVFLHKKKSEYAAIREHLEVFEATDLIDKQVGKLSGGELQRVLLTMAVPVFAIVYRLVKRWCEKRLIQKGKNPKTENYRKEIVRKKKKEEKKEEK